MTQTTSEQICQWRGPAVFSFGFRPFFLFGAVWAALAMALWIGMLLTVVTLPTRLDAASWHAHEFLFGYLGAIIAGFLLTAVPNWTGRLPVVGTQLAGLFAIWLVGRLAVATSAAWPIGTAEIVDLLFPVGLSLVILREIITGKNWRNLVVLALLAIFTLANLSFHIDAANGNFAAQGFGLRLGVGAVIMMVSVIGGRVVPSFTRNWLVQRKATRLPVPPMQRFDESVLVLTAVALNGWCLAPDQLFSGYALLIVGLLHLARLGRWQGMQTLSEPLLWILHLGYVFVPLGAIFLGLSIVVHDAGALAAAQHFWMAGAFGVMTMAMMTRATLGHTGQPLHAGPGTAAIYLALIGAVVARVGAAIWDEAAMVLYSVSGFLWVAAFLGFAIAYGPALLKPRPPRA